MHDATVSRIIMALEKALSSKMGPRRPKTMQNILVTLALACLYEYSYLAGFPESARRRAGHELFMAQVGRKPADYKPISTVGPGAYEIRVRGEAGAFRVIYVAKANHTG